MASAARLENPPFFERSGTGIIMRVAQKTANTIQHHRNAVLASPLFLAFLFGVLYSVSGPGFRHVIDFMAPGHLFGR
jgi:hypothetical protein